MPCKKIKSMYKPGNPESFIYRNRYNNGNDQLGTVIFEPISYDKNNNNKKILSSCKY